MSHSLPTPWVWSPSPCPWLASFTVRKGFVLGAEQGLGLLVPGVVLAAGGPLRQGGGGGCRHHPAGEPHGERVVRERCRTCEGRREQRVNARARVAAPLQPCRRGWHSPFGDTSPPSPTCGRWPVLPDAVGEWCPPVAVPLRVHRGDGGRPLARGQTRRRGLGLAAVGSGSDLWLPPSSCNEKSLLVTRLVVMGLGEGVRVPRASLLRAWKNSSWREKSSPRVPLAPRRGRVMGRALRSRAGGQVAAVARGGF